MFEFELLPWALKVSAKSYNFDRSENQKQSFRMFFKTEVFENLETFSDKHLCFSLFMIKFQTRRPATLLKTHSNIGVFLRHL